MDIGQLRHFIAVADAGSFSRAAASIFVTQPTLSSSIAKLEADLGQRLFVRLSTGVVMTNSGACLLPRARRIVAELAEARAEVRSRPRFRRLRALMIETAPVSLKVNLAYGMSRLWPDVRLSCAESTANEIETALFAGRIDAALARMSSRLERLPHRIVLDDRQVLAFSVAAARRLPRRLTPKILHQQPLVVRTHCEDTARAARVLDRLGVRPRVVFRTGDDVVALELIAAGVGACLLPSSFSHPGVALRSVAGVDLCRQLALVWQTEEIGDRIASIVASGDPHRLP